MNAPRTLQELLQEASGHGELSTRQLEMKVDTAIERGRLRARLNRVTIAKMINGSYKSRPTDDTIRAIAYLAGVNDEVAFTAAGRRTPGRPFSEDLPDGVDDLTPKEREAAVYMLRVLVQQRRELNHHEDQDTQNSQSNPPADGEARTSGAPMNDELGTQADYDLAAERRLDGPTDGELRRRPGADAGEENQDPGDGWEGA